MHNRNQNNTTKLPKQKKNIYTTNLEKRFKKIELNKNCTIVTS